MSTSVGAASSRWRRWITRRRKPLAVVTGIGTAMAALLVTLAGSADAATTAGIDVSHYQGTINWTSVRKAGIRFAFIKATEGTSVKDSRFGANYLGAYKAGVIRGGYHFALPNRSTGAAQANFLAKNGGAWSADSRTLPAAVDLEGNPYGSYCYGKTQASMRTWISDFLATYRARTRRHAVIYTTASWWKTCTGNWSGPWAKSPLWIARWSSTVGTLPTGTPFWSFWQYTSGGRVPGISGAVDRDYFNGTATRLVALANNK